MSAHDPHISPAAMPVAELGLDAFEVGVLAVLRHFLTTFAKPESQAWQQAYGIATQRWGASKGPQVAQGLLRVIDALRRARAQDLLFADPLCLSCREMATPDEVAFCTMLHAMRRNQTGAARSAVLHLTHGVMDPSLIEAGLSFAAQFPVDHAVQGRATRNPTTAHVAAPKLRLVH